MCSLPRVAGSSVVVPTPDSALPVSGFFSVAIRAFMASKALLKAPAASAPAVTAGK